MNKILALEFMAVNVSQNLNSMQKMSTQWNQRLIRYAFAKVIECLDKPNIRMNTECSKTNQFTKKHKTQKKWIEY